LSGNVGGGSHGEGQVGEAIVDSEEELGGLAVLELGEDRDRSDLSELHQFCGVEAGTGVAVDVENVCNVSRSVYAA